MLRVYFLSLFHLVCLRPVLLEQNSVERERAGVNVHPAASAAAALLPSHVFYATKRWGKNIGKNIWYDGKNGERRTADGEQFSIVEAEGEA